MIDRLNDVRELVSLAFGVPLERVDAQTAQEDLIEWDSIGHLNLMLMVEDTFCVNLDLDNMGRLRSVGAIVMFLGTVCPSPDS